MHRTNSRLLPASRLLPLAAASVGVLTGLMQLAGWIDLWEAGAPPGMSRADERLMSGLALLATSGALVFGRPAGRRRPPLLAIGAGVDLLFGFELLFRECWNGAAAGREPLQSVFVLLHSATLLGLGLAQVSAVAGRRRLASAFSQLFAVFSGTASLAAFWIWFYERSSGNALSAVACANLVHFVGSSALSGAFFFLRPKACPASLLCAAGNTGVTLRLLVGPVLLLPFVLNWLELNLGGESASQIWFLALDAVLVSLFSGTVAFVASRLPLSPASRKARLRVGEPGKPSPSHPLDGLPFAVLLLNERGIERCNRAAAAFLGFDDPARAEGRSLLDFVDHSDRCAVALGLEQACRGGPDLLWRKRMFRRLDGRRVYAEVSIACLETDAGRRVRAIVRDLESERRAGDLLRRDAQILAQVREPVVCLDLDGTVTYWNDAARRLLDGPGARGPGFSLLSLASEEDRSAAEKSVSLAGEGFAQELDFRSQAARGKERRLSGRLALFFDAEARPKGLLCFLREYPETGARREFVEEAGAAFRGLFDNALFGVLVLSPAGEILAANARFLSLSGYALEELGRRPVRSLIHSDDVALEELRRAEAFKGRGASAFEVRYLRPDGSIVWLEAAIAAGLEAAFGRPLLLCVLNDIGRRRALEAQVLQTQKMETVGKLAGGIAHDFGNVLTAIQGHVTLLDMNEEFPETGRESLSEIAGASRRAASLTRQLLLFSRRQAMQPKLQDLNLILGQFVKMLQRLIGEDVRLQWSPGGAYLPVRADAGMIDQIVMNLAVNARDAMPGGGLLTVETGEEYLAELPEGMPDLAPGRYAWFRVKDTGFGIARENLGRIFEPFFTTKEAGKGTGLGLSTVSGIVRQHRGAIRVESQEGRGTTFTVLLPRADGVLDGVEESARSSLPCGDGETVLLVEDDVSIGEIVAKVLERGRYRVLAAGDFGSALALWERERGRVDLLLADVVLPGGLDGVRLAEELTRRSPRLRVLLASGYGSGLQAALAQEKRGWTFLRKPFEVGELLESVRKALSGVCY